MKQPTCLIIATALHLMIVSCTTTEKAIDTDDVYLKATKKETCLQSLNKNIWECKLMSDPECGKNCFKANNMCDCRGQGVYSSCNSALSTNSFKQAVYWIFHTKFSHLMAVECMFDNTGESVAVFHHDNENATLVNGYEDKGSYKREFHYGMEMETIITIINKSSSCKQYSKAKCYNVQIDGFNWLSGRGGRKLNYWGGGPSEGKGCACGINGACVIPSKKCNFDENDYNWREDEGLVTKKEDLPITAMNAGETGSSYEKLFYTIGPLMCVF